MNYSKVEVIEMMRKHTQDLRRSLSGEPSEATLAAWRLNDAKYKMLLDYYTQQEDDDDFTVNFTSEVKKP